MRRTLLASLLPALAIAATWLSLEDPRLVGEGLAVALLAIVPALVRRGAMRVGAVVLSALGAAWIAFGAEPWELVPFRDERVLAPALRDTARGIVDFYEVFLPFEPAQNPEMHALVLCAIFGFVAAMALFVAARRPLGAAAVTVAGVGWPATLLGGQAIAAGAVALAAALAIPLILRATSVRTVLAGGAIGALVVVGAAWTSSATTLARDAAVDWETWDIRGQGRQASEVRFIWDSNYEGIAFPSEKTVVLRVDGPSAPHYWRTTTLDVYDENHWFERLFWLEQVDHDAKTLQLPQLIPARARNRDGWIEQRIRVDALVDDHLAAAGTPVALDGRGLGTVFLLSGGVLRVRTPVGEGESYRVWSYAPDPRSASARPSARPKYPFAASRFLEVDGREFPAFGLPGREGVVRALFDDPSYAGFARHRPMYQVARRVAGGAATPYAAVLAIESWLRQTGGFTLRRVAAARAGCSARLVRDADEGRLLPALRRGDGRDAADARGSRSRRGRLHERHAGRRHVGRDRPRRACLGRGVVRGHRLGSVRSDARPRHARRRVLVRVRPPRMPSHALRRGELGESTTPALPPRVPDAGDLPETTGASELEPGAVARRRRARSRGALDRASRTGEGARAGALATCRATRAALRRRAVVSSRTSCATRASTFRRTRRSWRCREPSTTSSVSTDARSPPRLRVPGSARRHRSDTVGRRRAGRCAG